MEHSIHEGFYLCDITLGIALDVEVERQITPDAAAIADDGGVGILVFGPHRPSTTQHFHALVIAIGGASAVLDRADHAIGKVQQDGRCVHVARLPNSWVHHHTCHDEDFIHFTAGQETG